MTTTPPPDRRTRPAGPRTSGIGTGPGAPAGASATAKPSSGGSGTLTIVLIVVLVVVIGGGLTFFQISRNRIRRGPRTPPRGQYPSQGQYPPPRQ
ncbi:MAG TPA: hypothetical protein VF060_36130 [Trebonia sp.]